MCIYLYMNMCMHMNTYIYLSIHMYMYILEDAELQLRTRWGHAIKPSSRMVLACSGSAQTPADPAKWPLVT